MKKRLAVVAIIVEDLGAAAEVNAILHAYAEVIVGRMGIPCRDRGVSVMSVIVDAAEEEISAMTGKLGRIRNVAVKTAMAKGC